MGAYVVGQLVKAMTKRRLQVDGARILVMGLAFKENCPDLRNTRVVDIVKELQDYNCKVDVYDPWISTEEALLEYGVSLVTKPSLATYVAIIVAVAHNQFREMGSEAIRSLGVPGNVLYDLKYLFPVQESDLRL
jgi:UDP-N-acetyl-D-galactosamine dehydrogenase